MNDRLEKLSQGDRLARDLPPPESMQRQASIAFGTEQAYLQTVTTEGERFHNLPSEM